MKKLLLVLTITAFVSTVAVAQQDQSPAKQDQQKVDWEKKFKEELKLTPEQSTKFDALSKEYKGKMDAIQSDAALTDDARKEKKMALKKEKETKLFEFLTPEQQTKYKEIMERKKAETKPAS